MKEFKNVRKISQSNAYMKTKPSKSPNNRENLSAVYQKQNAVINKQLEKKASKNKSQSNGKHFWREKLKNFSQVLCNYKFGVNNVQPKQDVLNIQRKFLDKRCLTLNQRSNATIPLSVERQKSQEKEILTLNKQQNSVVNQLQETQYILVRKENQNNKSQSKIKTKLKKNFALKKQNIKKKTNNLEQVCSSLQKELNKINEKIKNNQSKVRDQNQQKINKNIHQIEIEFQNVKNQLLNSLKQNQNNQQESKINQIQTEYNNLIKRFASEKETDQKAQKFQLKKLLKKLQKIKSEIFVKEKENKNTLKNISIRIGSSQDKINHLFGQIQQNFKSPNLLTKKQSKSIKNYKKLKKVLENIQLGQNKMDSKYILRNSLKPNAI